MQSLHTTYTDKSLPARDILLNSAHATVDPTLVVCYHAHCSIAYVAVPGRNRTLFRCVF